MLVRRRRRRIRWRLRYHLPPEKAREISAFRPGDVPIRYVEVGIPIMIEVPEVRAPGPAPHLHPSLLAHILEYSIAAIPIERIAPRVPLVQRPDRFRSLLLKNLLR